MPISTIGTAGLDQAANVTLCATSGNVGVGVTPSAWGILKALEFSGGTSVASDGTSVQLTSNAYYNGTNWIYKNSAGAGNYYINNNTHNWRIAASGTAGNTISFTQAMTLDASGNLGIGTISPSTYSIASNLVVETATSGGLTIRSGVNGYGGVFFADGTTGTDQYRGFIQYNHGFSSPNDAMIFGTSGSNRMYIDSSGNVLMGTNSAAFSASPGFKINPTGVVGSVAATASGDAYNYYNTTAGAYRFYVSSGGTIFATSTTISAISDIRFKENVQDLDVGLDAVMALKPRKFDWKEGKGKDIKGDRGFIAQEFEQVFPDMIDEWKDESPEGEEPYKSVRADVIPVLVKAIQELKAIVDAQAVEIAALKGQA